MANSIQLHYADTGVGLPVVLLHGFPFHSGIWHEQVRALTGLYRMITPDLRGFGKSIAPAGVYEMDVLAADVLALLDQLNIRQCVLIGHSMGGYVALAAYKMFPERIQAFGLIASQAGADTEEARQNRLNTVEKVLQAGDKGAQVIVDGMLPKLFAKESPPEPEISEEITKIILGTDVAGIVGALKGMANRPDSNPILPEMNIPVLLLAGDQDQIIPAAKAETMASVLPNPTHIVVENAGHMLMLEQPGATTEALKTFLAPLKD
jgi:3-oxoadipate enol-lactonase